MRTVDGQTYYTIGEMAAAVGVSRQTLRLWERKGYLSPTRSTGGQRLYRRDDLFAANNVELLRGRHGWNPALRRNPAVVEQARQAWESLFLGRRIRAARRSRGLSMVEAADRVGISRSFLGSIERGQANASANMMSRIADALHMPQSAFSAPRELHAVHITRADERPMTLLDQGVRWEELSPPGQLLEPALLVVPPGAASGGSYVRPGDSFAYVVSGSLTFSFGTRESEQTLGVGDSVVFPGQSPVSWQNLGDAEARVVWVEQLMPDAWEDGDGVPRDASRPCAPSAPRTATPKDTPVPPLPRHRTQHA